MKADHPAERLRAPKNRHMFCFQIDCLTTSTLFSCDAIANPSILTVYSTRYPPLLTVMVSSVKCFGGSENTRAPRESHP
eukprot:2899073-Prymnesium_polylepis.2